MFRLVRRTTVLNFIPLARFTDYFGKNSPQITQIFADYFLRTRNNKTDNVLKILKNM
jgi:hypothetical protein